MKGRCKDFGIPIDEVCIECNAGSRFCVIEDWCKWIDAADIEEIKTNYVRRYEEEFHLYMRRTLKYCYPEYFAMIEKIELLL